MNIIVIGSMRTKSTALVQYMAKQYPKHIYWGEPFYELTIRSENQIIKNKDKFIHEQIKKMLDQLFSSNNNIIKILGINLNGMYKFIDKIPIEKFDLINLIERKDFFDQVCSGIVAKKNKIYHTKTKSKAHALEKKYSLSKENIISTAFDIYNYIMIKKYLHDCKIPYVQYTYEDLPTIENISIIPNNYDYNDAFINYHLKSDINNLFYKHFDYQTFKADLDAFKIELDNLLF